METYACPTCDYRFTVEEFRLIKLTHCPRPNCYAKLENFVSVAAQPRKGRKK
jgi:uncharacterized paraquat-inducible protein A